jgi:hypothetical protein
MEEAIRTIVSEQERIGWDNAIHGLLSKAWIDLASLSYDRETRSFSDGEFRMRRCLEALHVFPWDCGNLEILPSITRTMRQLNCCNQPQLKKLHTYISSQIGYALMTDTCVKFHCLRSLKVPRHYNGDGFKE